MLFETIFGGITGLATAAITAVANYKNQKLKNEMEKFKAGHELNRMDKEMEIIKAETTAQVTITKAEIEGAIELAEMDAYKEAQKAGGRKMFSTSFAEKLIAIEGKWRVITVPIGSLVLLLFGLVDFLKALMRPGLTMYLTGMTTYITIIAYDILQQTGSAITPEQAFAIFDQVITTVIYLTVTCVTFWFADRRMAKFLMRLNDGNLKGDGTNIPI